MAQRPLSSFLSRSLQTCRRCRPDQGTSTAAFSPSAWKRSISDFRAAPEIDLEEAEHFKSDTPARILPASSSYFTGSPVFTDNLLQLQALANEFEDVPLLPAERAPPMAWLRLGQYQSNSGERVTTTQYAQLIHLATRLNRIHPQLRTEIIDEILLKFQRPGAGKTQQANPGTIDQYGRSKGVGRRKESSAQVYLVEGQGEVLVNNRSIIDIFPRLHDRESLLWPLKVCQRIDKYNVFALVSGGGVTGQAEAITLGLARALLVHEPALKPVLRRAGCVTRDRRVVERKKPGRLKARKKPAWVKR